MVGNITFLMIFAVIDPSPLEWINCSIKNMWNEIDPIGLNTNRDTLPLIFLCKMAGERLVGKLSNDFEDHTSGISRENHPVDNDAHFSDPEEFVDRVSDEGLLHMLIVVYLLLTRVAYTAWAECGMRKVKCGMETVERCCGTVCKMRNAEICRMWLIVCPQQQGILN